MNLKLSQKEQSILAAQRSADYILSIQKENGAIPWFKDGKLDPWGPY